MSSTNQDKHFNEIAVIGMSCRFPGSRNPREFWQNLSNGVESVTFFSDEELLAAGVAPSDLDDPKYVKANAVLEEIEMFDASFFGFTPREAQIMDPQHRFFLECAWEALENGGYDAEKFNGSIGVYAGASMNSYLLHNLYSNKDLMESVGGLALSVASNTDSLSTRNSYKLNLRGPSIAVQSACSTSLVAIHVACQSLLGGECDIALAGGVSIICPQNVGYSFQQGGIFSPDGHCRAFDAKAEGTIGGRGVGIVLLKRLTDALEDGDSIQAVIRGSAVNNDGSAKVGFTAPSVEGQAEVIAEALAVAGVEPQQVSYVETHGTGTTLGDPIEMAALTRAFGNDLAGKRSCAVGSVKTNIGHADAAAGAAGLIKTVLALKHQQLPPSLHFEKPNPEIDFDQGPFYVNRKLSEWRTAQGSRIAGVSSFGIGGTNAHVVVEEPPPCRTNGNSRDVQLLLLSAKTKTAVDHACANLAEALQADSEINVADVAYTLQVGRRDFGHRRMLVCRTRDEAVKKLETLDRKQVVSSSQEPTEKPVAFMFPGQGAQYVNMGAQLYQKEPTFRVEVDRCCDLLKSDLGFDLRDVLYPGDRDTAKASEKLKQTSTTQPALFVIEYGLAKLWMAWGVRPQAMIGHSIGEYVAACLAGVFSLEDALRLVAARGRLMQEMPAGSMLAIPMPEVEVKALLDEKLDLAAVNAPSLSVVSGPTQEIERFEQLLAERDIEGRRLHTSHAFHSAMMNEMLARFARVIGQVRMSAPKIPFVSNVTGTWITAEQATDADYWTQHVRQTVQFARGVGVLLHDHKPLLLEVGPGQALSTLARQCSQDGTQTVALPSMRHPRASESDVELLLTTLGKLWLNGIKPDWSGFYSQEERRRIPLPTYPFQRKRYWVEPQSEGRATQNYNSRKKQDVAEWFYIPSWKRSALPVQDNSNDPESRQSRWLVFADACGLATQLVGRLEQRGREVTVVTAGQSYADLGSGKYEIDPENREDYIALTEALAAQHHLPSNIVYLWGVTPDQEVQSDDPIESPDRDFYSLIFLAQALGEQNRAEPARIVAVTNGLQEVIGEDVPAPGKATVLGPCRVIPQEYENLDCRSVDLILPESGRWREEAVDQLISEAISEASDLVVAYRGGHRWLQTFEPVRFEGNQGTPSRLRKDGVYLITGGLGGIGLALAEYLAQTVKAKLILVGRQELPSKDDWGPRLAQNDDDPVSRKMRTVMALEALGSEVLIASADVADFTQMAGVVELANKKFGEIHGVIHSGGIAGGGIIQLKDPGAAAKVLSAKVQGTLVLERLFREKELDFFVLCSSLASVVGGFGQADYCAANSFLDAFAQHHSAATCRFTVSINWDTWTEVGMAVETEVPPELKDEREEALKKGILSEEGKQAFHRILQGALPQVLVSTRDLQPRIDEQVAGRLSSELDLEETESSGLSHERPELSSEFSAPESEVEKTVARIWGDLFGIEKVGRKDDFFELGGHSLLATQLIGKIGEKYPEAKLSIRVLFDNTTVAALANLIESSNGQPGSETTKSIRERILKAPRSERQALVEKYLRELITQAVGEKANLLPENGSLAKGDLAPLTKELIWRCRQDFKFRIYPHEILSRPSIPALAEFVAGELDRIAGTHPGQSELGSFSLEGRPKQNGRSPKVKEKNGSMIFLLSAPRSGSTLLRLMLAGHSRLFCPPELGLLAFETIGDLEAHLGRHPIQASQGSSVEFALREFMSQEEARELVRELVRRNAATSEVYRLIQERAGQRTVVDKSPSYALNMSTLEYAERLFQEPKYIYLVRHPYAMIESSARYRLQAYFSDGNVDPYLFADSVWATANGNLTEFLRTVDDKRHHLIYFEDLVRDPAKALTGLCAFLGIDFEEGLLRPYDDGRMIDGPGDLDILRHDKIDASLGKVWKRITLPRRLKEASRTLAAGLNYELPNDVHEVRATLEIVNEDHAQKLLDNIDELSDEEVHDLLDSMTSDLSEKK